MAETTKEGPQDGPPASAKKRTREPKNLPGTAAERQGERASRSRSTSSTSTKPTTSKGGGKTTKFNLKAAQQGVTGNVPLEPLEPLPIPPTP